MRIKKMALTLVMVMSLGVLSNASFAGTTKVVPPVESNQSKTTDDISYSGNIVMDSKFDTIVQKLRDYKAKNPKASEKELNDYAKSLVKGTSTSGQITVAAAGDLDGYITGKLNSQELVLYNSNYFKALLCMANGKLAIQYAQSNYQNILAVQWNGNGDAFRHTLWNYGMSQDVGVAFAKTWGDAHENGTPNNPALEKQMDLFNNGVGRYQYQLNGFSSISFMISKTKERVSAGGCYIIRNNKLVNSDSVGKL